MDTTQNEATDCFDAHYLGLCDLESFHKETILFLYRLPTGLGCGKFYSEKRVIFFHIKKIWFYSVFFIYFFTSLIMYNLDQVPLFIDIKMFYIVRTSFLYKSVSNLRGKIFPLLNNHDVSHLRTIISTTSNLKKRKII